MSSQLPQRVVLSEHVLVQPLQNEAVMLDLDSEYYHTLDDVALRVWELLREDNDVENLVARLRDEYEVDEATLRGDLATLLAEWRAAGLVAVEA